MAKHKPWQTSLFLRRALPEFTQSKVRGLQRPIPTFQKGTALSFSQHKQPKLNRTKIKRVKPPFTTFLQGNFPFSPGTASNLHSSAPKIRKTKVTRSQPPFPGKPPLFPWIEAAKTCISTSLLFKVTRSLFTGIQWKSLSSTLLNKQHQTCKCTQHHLKVFQPNIYKNSLLEWTPALQCCSPYLAPNPLSMERRCGSRIVVINTPPPTLNDTFQPGSTHPDSCRVLKGAR